MIQVGSSDVSESHSTFPGILFLPDAFGGMTTASRNSLEINVRAH